MLLVVVHGPVLHRLVLVVLGRAPVVGGAIAALPVATRDKGHIAVAGRNEGETIVVGPYKAVSKELKDSKPVEPEKEKKEEKGSKT